jgi:hypothetical protein
LKVSTGPVCCEIVRPLLQTLRVYIYTLALTRLLVDHDYNIYCLKLISWRHVRLVPVINSSLSLYSIRVITHSRMLSAFTRGIVLLPNDDVLPTTDASTECFGENPLPNGALLPNSAHMLVSSLYQFLVLTGTSSGGRPGGWSPPDEHAWFQQPAGPVGRVAMARSQLASQGRVSSVLSWCSALAAL